MHQELLAKIEKARNEKDLKSKELQETEIRISSLKDFINEDKSPRNIDSWLASAGINKNQPILDQIEINDGWDTAFGYFLENHLHAYESSNFDIDKLNERPNKSIILIDKNTEKNLVKTNEKLISATSVINAKSININNSLNEWLFNVYLSDKDKINDHRKILKYGDILILKNGDIYGKTYQIIRSKNGTNINILARKKQLDELMINLPVIKKSFEKVAQELNQIQEESRIKEEEFANHAAQELNQIQEESKIKEEEFANERHKLFESDKLKQEIEFNIKLSTNKNDDLSEKIQNIDNEKNDLNKIIEDSIIQLKDNSIESFESDLKIKIAEKQKAEGDLTLIREKLTTKEDNLKNLESSRLEKQHSLSPLQESLQEIKIEEREVKVFFEQCCNELDKSSLNEEELLNKLSAEDNIDTIEERCIKITEKIEKLGPVNLAAIDELDVIEKRESYLQKQMDDLVEASNTLEQAIKKIDIETREKLAITYKTVNDNFNLYFQKLFGGGRAKLELIGEQILDSGFQVVAQPPGLKNTTVVNLSGGQKALTGIALVFALFKLNPAPFCIMDEVDAPLSEGNVDIFCDIVKTMSESTQIILVTHQKLTMEMTDQLIGVTSAEKGVSRIVEVNLQDVEKVEVTN